MLAALGTLLWSSFAFADDLPSPLTASAVVAALRKNNPELAERRAMATAATARPRQVSQLDDPMLSLEWWQQPINFATVPIMLSVRQPLPWPGKLRARRDVAARQAATARDQVTDVERKLETQAKIALYDLAFAERALAINDRDRTLVEAMVKAAEAKYRVGKAPQAAMLKTQEDLLTVENQRLDLERDRDEARARLNALLDRPASAPLPTVALPTAPERLPSETALVAIAETHRPDVELATDAIAEAQAKLALARRESNPELAVWAGYMVNIRGTDTFTTGVSTTLPFFSSRRRSAASQAAEAELEAARAGLQAAKRRAEAEVHTALLQIDAALRHERLHSEKLIPLSELSLQSAQSAYENDRIDFFSVLDAARMVRDHHLNHERYLVEYGKRLAELELAVGQDLAEEVTP
ncbi:MAG TPA: TolC family protein [Polyangia bacterium]|nr:TolC family protein [Polyangia bacterium]